MERVSNPEHATNEPMKMGPDERSWVLFSKANRESRVNRELFPQL